MSDYDDGIELDDDELQELYEYDQDNLTPEDVFSLVLINKRTKKKVTVQLEDKDGDRIELADLLEELVKYIQDKLAEDNNQMTDEIMPLMSQTLVSGMGRMIGIQPTAAFVTNPNTRMALIYMMMISFTMYKLVQVKGLRINTVEEEVTDEEIEEIERKSKASSVATMSAMLGIDPREALRQMVDRGDLTENDLEEMLRSSRGVDEDDEKNN